ncbi:MAG: hypothetical protein R3B09_23370 [Nannocystaceae bacterium]
MSSAGPSTPRLALALVSLFQALVFAAAGWLLPWGSMTPFAIAAGALAALHGLTSITALIGSGARAPLWRVTSAAALIFLGWVTYLVVDGAVYVAVLYGGLGEGVAIGIAAAWCVLVLFTLPTAIWGIAATGGLRGLRGRRLGGAAAVLLALVAVGLGRDVAIASDDPRPRLADRPEALLAEFQALADDLPAASKQAPVPSLMTRTPTICERAPEDAPITVLVHYPRRGEAPDPLPMRPTSLCVQGEPEAIVGELRARLADAHSKGPIKIDVVVAATPLTSATNAPDAFSVRPGVDGVCRKGRCFAPWQMVALDQFTSNAPLPFIDDFRFGVDARRLAGLFTGQAPEERLALDGLTRITTWSYLIDADGVARYTPRMREQADARPLTRAHLDEAVRLAELHILAAQGDDGRFRYLLNPFTGRVSWRGFAVPRQAGTTLALCEVASDTPPVNAAVRSSLKMLSTLERRRDGFSALAVGSPERPPQFASLGTTALSLIAFLGCRPRMGDEFDRIIGDLGRYLLTVQRTDGGFYPGYSLKDDAIVEGPDPLYAGGQAVFALSLLEAAATEAAADPSAPKGVFPPVEQLRDAVERAMHYTATRYWDHGLEGFFYLEENWHCLAARASLGHHRNDAYERFCVDYVTFKGRMIFDEESRVDPDYLGAYGFGQVIPPHNTPSGGFGEALAAAMALKEARGESIAEDQATMARVLGFLVRQQWRRELCFACAERQVIAGGFSESLASPEIRIDYVQHTMAALGHGGRLLELE